MNYSPYSPSYPPQFTPQMGRTDFMGQGYPLMPQMAQTAPVGQGQGFQTRPVTGREEAMAVQVDFLGPGTLMPDLAHGKIYFKRFNRDTGASDLFVFSMDAETNTAEPAAPEYATKADLQEMQQVIRGLAQDIDTLRAPMRGGKRLESDV